MKRFMESVPPDVSFAGGSLGRRDGPAQIKVPRLEDGRLGLTAFRSIERFASGVRPVLERGTAPLDRPGGGGLTGMVDAAAARACYRSAA
jgi:hypothetical protein